MEVLHSRLDAHDASDPNLHMILGRLETLVDRQEERIQALEGQLKWVQSHQALCPCIQSRALASVCEGSEEASKGSGEEVPMSPTSRPVSMTVVGSFHWGSEAGTAVGEAWGQEPDEEDGVEDEDTFMAHRVQIFKADEVEHEAVKWLAANPTRYKLEDSGSLVDVDCTVDLFELADCKYSDAWLFLVPFSWCEVSKKVRMRKVVHQKKGSNNKSKKRRRL